MNIKFLSLALTAVFLSGQALAQAPTQDPTAPKPGAPAQNPQKPAEKAGDKKEEPKKEEDKRTSEQKKYDELLKNGKMQSGLFKVHRVEDKIYWEIPESKLGRLLMWQTEVSQMPKELGDLGSGANLRYIRFAKRDKKIYLKNANYNTRGEGDEGTLTGIAANTVEPILMTFDTYAEAPDKSIVIDVTQLFLSDPQDFSVRAVLPTSAGVDGSKSYIEKVKAFPTNIETRSFLTFRIAGGRSRFGGYDSSTASTVVHYSLVELPEKPLMGRLKDSRIGFFTTGFTQYGTAANKAKPIEYINRFRLEKKDAAADVSEPIKPITFYLGKEVPVKWRKWIKAGIEDWQPVFERAGFKNAIIAKDAPSTKEDPDWDAEDARYSVIRWVPSETENAMGPSIQDPRSGETISAHVIVWNDIVKLVQDWYFAQAGAADPAGHNLPYSDDKIGRMVQYVVCHEVGHTLGLEHNFKASTAYSIKQLRTPSFMDKYGTAASIMAYSRNNYVAQPGDGVTNFIPKIGPYDYFAIEYGYKPISGANTPEAEKSQLDLLLAKQITDRTVRFGNYKYIGTDPTTQSENIGDDTVEATRLGLMNIELNAKKYLIPAGTKYGESYDDLAALTNQLLGQWRTELFHLLPVVGGVVELDAHVGRGNGQIFKAVPAAQQSKAVNLLLTKGIRQPSTIFTTELLSKITPVGPVSSYESLQSFILRGLFTESRIKRIQDTTAREGASAYTVSKLVDDVVNGVFAELNGSNVVVDASGRNLHRSFIKLTDERLNGSSASATDLKPLLKDGLRNLARRIDVALPKVKDRLTSAHLRTVREDISKVLDDKYSRPAGGGGSFSLADLLGGGIVDFTTNKDLCWGNTIPAALIEIQKDYDAAHGITKK